MKKTLYLLFTFLLFSFGLMSFSPGKKKDFSSQQSSPLTQQYIVLAWNDLGMHCANLDFANMCILPPYNNQKVQVILRGSPSALPQLMRGSDGFSVTYEIPGNSQSATKTNFWNYAQQLFGVPLPANIGLTGAGMTGLMMSDTSKYFRIEGIPITAFPDATPTAPDPYQLTLMKVYDATQQLVGTTQSVIPVAHEINCVSSGCHTSELSILQNHEQVSGFNINNRPILCANCHADAALGKPGQPGIDPFSEVIHKKHEFINSGTTNDCYKCHPGPNTQCWRDVMHGSQGGITKCQDCHGSVKHVGESISSGRQPWLQEPSCGASSCHGPNYAEEPGKLFRESKGHGGLFCSACHGSPHAIFPSVVDRDNVQNVNVQGFSGTLTDCSVCHGYMPAAPGPHGIKGSMVQNVNVVNGQANCYNATGLVKVAGEGTTVTIQPGGSATFIAGYRIRLLPGFASLSGSFLHGYITTTGQYCTNPAPSAFAMVDGIPGNDETAAMPTSMVYPNPTASLFTLRTGPSFPRDETRFEVFTSRGDRIISGKMAGERETMIDLQHYSGGVFLVHITAGNLSETLRIVRQ